MVNEVTAKDPFGKMIYFSPGRIVTENDSEEIYDEVVTVIKKPAIVIEVKQNSQTELYYFRSVGWNNTLLISVRLNNGRWEAYECLKNPSSELLSALLKKGKQLL